MVISLKARLDSQFSGFSGYSGVGQSGYSGTSGYSGLSGYSGRSGYSGFAVSGFTGAPMDAEYWSPYPSVDAATTTYGLTSTTQFYATPFALPVAIPADQFRYIGSFISASGTVPTTSSAAAATSTINFDIGTTFGIYQVIPNLIGTGDVGIPYAFYSVSIRMQHLVRFSTAGSVHTVTLNLTYPVNGTTSLFTTSYSQSSTIVPLFVSQLTAFTGFRNIVLSNATEATTAINTTNQLSAGFYVVARSFSSSNGASTAAGGTQTINYGAVHLQNNFTTLAAGVGFAPPGAGGGLTGIYSPFPLGGIFEVITQGGPAFFNPVAGNAQSLSNPLLWFAIHGTGYSTL